MFATALPSRRLPRLANTAPMWWCGFPPSYSSASAFKSSGPVLARYRRLLRGVEPAIWLLWRALDLLLPVVHRAGRGMPVVMCGRVRLSNDVSEIELVFSIPRHRPGPTIGPSWTGRERRVGGALARGNISQLAARPVIPDNCLVVTGITGIL